MLISPANASRFTALLLSVSLAACGSRGLPDAPAFDELGLADSFETIHTQVQGAYEAWQASPRDAALNGQMGMLLSTYDRDAMAEIFYRRAHLLAPDEFRWAFYLATTLKELGRNHEAIAMFRSAIRIDPDYAEARIQLAGLLLRSGQVQQSVDLYGALTTEFPSRVEGWLGLGKALERSGDLAGAIDALQRAKMVGPQYGEVHYALANAWRASGDDEGAAREFAAYDRTASTKIRMQDRFSREILLLHQGDAPHIGMAQGALARNKLQEAVFLVRKALDINPLRADSWAMLVHLHVKRNDLDTAERAYREALDAGISYARLHYLYGEALAEVKRYGEARQVLGEAIKLDPKYVDALSALGNLEFDAGAIDLAADYYGRALVVRPNDHRLTLKLARTLNSMGQYQRAADWLEPLKEDSTENLAAVLTELAIAYNGMNSKSEATSLLHRARDLASQSADSALLAAIDELLAGQ